MQFDKLIPLKNSYLFVILLVLFCGSNASFAQKITGQYYGIGTVGKDGNYSQYLSELILKQTGDKVSGEYNYFFKSSYVPSRVSGIYNAKTRVLELKVFPVLNFKAANTNGADCPMKGYFTLKVSRAETTLSGQFETTDHYKFTCPDIVLRLKKEVLTPKQKKELEDAKLQTDVADNDEEANETHDQPSVTPAEIKQTPAPTVAKQEEKQPVAKEAVASSMLPAVKPDGEAATPGISITKPKTIKADVAVRSTTKQPVTKDALATIEQEKSIQKATPISTIPLKKTKSDEVLIKNLVSRSFEESPVIEVDVDSLKVTLYDNGEVDGDTVAVFHNRKLLLRDQRLSDQPVSVTIAIDTTIHEISMFAENLGRIPPNTAACIIMAGEKRFEVLITSSYIKNGTIRFRKKTALQIEAEGRILK